MPKKRTDPVQGGPRSDGAGDGKREVRRRTCKAFARTTGEQCANPPMAGQRVCRMHGGAAPAARERAKQRLLDAVDPLMKRLIEFAHDDSKPPAVQLKAIRDALDRAGFGATQNIHVQAKITPWDEMLEDTDGDPVVTFSDVEDDDELLHEDDEPDALAPPPVRRVLPPAPDDRGPSEPLEGVVLDPPRPNGPTPIPPHVRDAFRRSGRLD